MAKLSDAARLSRLVEILRFLTDTPEATVGELSSRFGGSCRSVYDDLLAAWMAEDPEHMGRFPLRVHVEYFERGDPGWRPIADRRVWLCTEPDDRTFRWLLGAHAAGTRAADRLAQPSKSSE
jgi:hypothetical protein